MDNSTSRRHFLRTAAGTATSLGLAGCSSLAGNADQDTYTDETTTTVDFDGQTNISRRTRKEVILPTVWQENHKLEDFSTLVDFSLQANRQMETIEVEINGKSAITLKAGSKQFSRTGFEVPVYVLDAGKNRIEIDGHAGDETISTEKVTVKKILPDLTKRDIHKIQEEKLRQKAKKNEGKNYLQQHEIAADKPPYSNYRTPEKLRYNKVEIDLAALEYWHDNNFPYLSQEGSPDAEIDEFLNSIGDPDKSVANNPKDIYYPNGNPKEGDLGSFSTRKFTETDVGWALKWFQRYYFNWEHENDRGSNSTEDVKHAVALQEAFDRYRDGEIHAWAFDLPENSLSTHGNGFVWDEKNDDLYVLETVTAPETSTYQDPQLIPLVENSNYLPPELRKKLGGQTSSGNTAYSHWWHPIRFDGTEPALGLLSFSDGKSYATGMLMGIAECAFDDNFYNGKEVNYETGTGITTITTGYLEDRVAKLRNYNQNDFNFERLKNEAKIIIFSSYIMEENAVVYQDDEGKMQLATGEEITDHLVEEIWEDDQRRYDDFDTYLKENGQDAKTALRR